MGNFVYIEHGDDTFIANLDTIESVNIVDEDRPELEVYFSTKYVQLTNPHIIERLLSIIYDRAEVYHLPFDDHSEEG